MFGRQPGELGREVDRRSQMGIRVKRVYEPASTRDGRRILVDRLWPRGLSKADAKIDDWPKDIAPSTELRKWFGHDPERWSEFKRRYFAELESKSDTVRALLDYVRAGTVTFLYSSKERRLNNVVALKEYLESRL